MKMFEEFCYFLPFGFKSFSTPYSLSSSIWIIYRRLQNNIHTQNLKVKLQFYLRKCNLHLS